jgi:hypothetical protein
MAGLGWIDFSPEHRDKVATVLEQLRPEGRVDELGIGVIRNALSDFFFPGTSTIQTRAKYFIIIPRIINDYQAKYENKKNKPKFKDYLRDRENQIIRALAEKYKDTGEQGIIGISLAGTPKNNELVRKPSSIYWTGLRRFRIIKTILSLTEYVAKQDKQDTFIDLLQATEKEKGDDGDAGYDDTFGICLPDNNKNWDKGLSINLAYEEAAFLSDKIIDNHKHTLIGQILKYKKWMNAFVRANNFKDMCDLFLEQKFSEEITTYLKMARDFDGIIHGAHIRYNCLLQERFGTEKRLGEFSTWWNQWWWQITNDGGMVDQFDEDLLFQLSKTLRPFTRKFVQSWIEGIRKSKPSEFFDRLVIEQERWNKGGKARLRPGADEKVDGWIGIDGLSYRFPVARTIVSDIKRGLEA